MAGHRHFAETAAVRKGKSRPQKGKQKTLLFPTAQGLVKQGFLVGPTGIEPMTSTV
jgi:hypothetical protein